MKLFGNALRAAALFAVIYFILSCAYIVVTDKLVLIYASGDSTYLYRAGLIKGLIFMLINSAIFFTLSYFLIRKIHSALHLLDANKQIMLSLEKRSMVGVFAASSAHDANNSLAIIRIKLALLEKKLAIEDGNKDIEAINASIDKIENILRKMKDLTKENNALENSTFDVGSLIRATIDFSRLHPKLKHAEITFSDPAAFTVKGDPHLFEQAMLNMLINSAESSNMCQIKIKCVQDNKSLNIEIHDNGSGFSQDTLQKLETGFYTTKEYGTGLGLLTVQSSAHNLGGRIEYKRSSDLGGALIRILVSC